MLGPSLKGQLQCRTGRGRSIKSPRQQHSSRLRLNCTQSLLRNRVFLSTIDIYPHDSAEMLFHLVALAAVSSATALPPHYTSDSSAVAPNTTTLDKRDCVPYKNTCAGPSFLRIDDRHAHLTISRCRESHEHSPLISSSVDLNDCLAATSGHLVPGRGYCSLFQGSRPGFHIHKADSCL